MNELVKLRDKIIRIHLFRDGRNFDAAHLYYKMIPDGANHNEFLMVSRKLRTDMFYALYRCRGV